MLELLAFIALPYLALGLLVVGITARYVLHRFSISSLSSQMLEDRWLGAGSVPWHFGILLVLSGHALAFLVPRLWRSLVSSHWLLMTVEFLGLTAAMACALGLVTLLARRLLRARVQRVTSIADYLVLVLLLVEVCLGISVAVLHRYGSSWSTGTVMPYVWSILFLHPDSSLVSDMPPLVQLHVVVAWVIVAITPFTRLIHAFFVPLDYLVRAPQRVVWTSARRREVEQADLGGSPDLARRHLVEGLVGVSAATTLLGVGVADKMLGYFQKPHLKPSVKLRVMQEKQLRLTMTEEERALELERLSNDTILIAQYEQLSPKKGKYFTDYEMRPALALLDDQGWPVLLSAKCTHLGCTVGSDVDAQGRLLCPCHISYFDAKTGVPQADAPAKAALPKLAWLAQDASGKVVANMDSAGRPSGSRDSKLLKGCGIYVVKPQGSEPT